MMLTAEKIIKLFKMKPLTDEGGFYAETYRCTKKIRFKTPSSRNISTAILYLLTPDTISKLHRLKNDEIFHFYLGDPVTMLLLHPNGKSKIVTLSHDILKGQSVQTIVPKNTWQGALLNKGGKFALLGTTVAPGFDFADFQLANRNILLKKFPAQKPLILQLT
jgi:predicted cupin superfamily sugar epimerase